MDFKKLENFRETAIVFSSKYSALAQETYDKLSEMYPERKVLLICSSDIICAAKTHQYESYAICGIECPLHSFDNAIYAMQGMPLGYRNKIKEHCGPVYVDSIYGKSGTFLSSHSTAPLKDADDMPPLIVTENQDVLDYYSAKFDAVVSVAEDVLQPFDRVRFLMKENAAAAKISNSKLFAVVFTSREYESLADEMVEMISTRARAYKVFLRDISYERLISIDTIDAIVLVNCPLFSCSVRTHISIVTPFTVKVWLEGKWNTGCDYDRNATRSAVETTGITVYGEASALLERKTYKGVPFSSNNSEEATTIQEGRCGVPMEYEDEKE